MAIADTPQTRIRGFLGETPRPRMPQPLTTIVGASGLESISRPPPKSFSETIGHSTSRKMSGNNFSARRHPYGAVPRWPETSDDPESYPSTRRGQPAATPSHGPAVDAHQQPYGTNSAVPHRYGATPILGHKEYALSSVARDASASRGLMDDHITTTTSRMLKSVNNSQEVVLFALHPQTIIRPLRRAIRQVFNGLLEWLLETMHRRGIPRNAALGRLNRTRWFALLFDYVSVERMLNIFKIYLSHSDALAVPRDFVDVYNAFSNEINRYCLSESMRTNMVEARSNRAFVVGGIDFTEETLKSMTRSIDPRTLNNSQTPYIAPQVLPTAASGVGYTGNASQGESSDLSQVAVTASSAAAMNRGYFLNRDNLTVIESLLSRLHSIHKNRQKELEVLKKEETEIQLRLQERKQLLLSRCTELMKNRISKESHGLKNMLNEIQQQFDVTSGSSNTAKALEEINVHMRAINKVTSVLSKL